MSANSGSRPISDSLLLSFDTGSAKSLPFQFGPTDHGVSDWYCFESGTATYACTEASTTIYQIGIDGKTSIAIITGTAPERGTLTVTSGCRYYGNKPISLIIEGYHHAMAPLSMASTLFIYIANRGSYENGYVYFYAPYADTKVTMYTAGSGVNGTPTAFLNIAKGSHSSFQVSALAWYYFVATNPVIGTAQQSYPAGAALGDKTILSPTSKTVYQGFAYSGVTSIGGTPTTVGTYVTADTTYPVMQQQIADGAGTDGSQGMAYENLCDRYNWGDTLSDYIIVTPYASTTITTYYWNGSAWTTWDTHSLSGSQLAPAQVQRDGTNGPGVTATIISGGAANMASGATLWKWEGNNPFFIRINDAADDEFAMMGWMNSRNTRNISNPATYLYDSTSNQNKGTILSATSIDSTGVTLSGADGSNISVPNIDLRTNFSLECWVNLTALQGGFFGHGTVAANQGLHTTIASNYTRFGMYANDSDFGLPHVTGTWSHYVFTYNHSTYAKAAYMNGVYYSPVPQQTQAAYAASPGVLRIGQNYGTGAYGTMSGKVAIARVYNRVLSAAEVLQNFRALRTRFGV